MYRHVPDFDCSRGLLNSDSVTLHIVSGVGRHLSQKPQVICSWSISKNEAFMGILPAFWITSLSGSCFCGGVTVQFQGLPASFKSSPYNTDGGQPPSGDSQCPPWSICWGSKPNLLTRGEKVREITGQSLKILALLLVAIRPAITEF